MQGRYWFTCACFRRRRNHIVREAQKLIPGPISVSPVLHLHDLGRQSEETVLHSDKHIAGVECTASDRPV